MARGRRQGTRTLVLIGAVAALAAATASSALAAGSGVVRFGRLPPLASAARTVGGLAASSRLRVTIVLKPRNRAALAAYARQVAAPGSAVYRDYLTPAQFGARFGASRAELDHVAASMRSHGLTPGTVSTNRLAVPVTGSVGAVQRAFGIFLRRVVLPSGRHAVTASAAPALDQAIAGDVQAVIGLTSTSSPKPLLERSAADTRRAAGDPAQSCSAASATAASETAYTANQIASAYGFTGLYASGDEGQGQTIAIYELESYDPSDIATYQSCYGTSASVSPVSIDGGDGSGAGSGEAALDIEQVIGLAPKAKILVYEGPNSSSDSPGSGPYDTLNAIVSAPHPANVVSISWGQCEQTQGSNALDAEQTLFEEAATQGQSVVSATGDQGSEDCSTPDGAPADSLAVDDPGSQQFVTGVGGTSLEAAGPPPSETVWNQSGPATGQFSEQGGAGGGGVSAAWTMPGYQRNAAKSLNVIGPYSSGQSCGNSGGYCREVPDVSADADPADGYVIYWNGRGTESSMPAGWQAVGGTSAGAPLWAALLADADSSTACHGSAIGFANPALYQAASSDYGAYFNDVTTGNNDFTGEFNGLYPAGPGYDMASGLGSPKAAALAGALCADALRVDNPGKQISTVGQPVSLRIRTSALSGSGLHFYASKLPPGLSLASSTGRITGAPKRIGTWSTGIAALDRDLGLRGTFFSWHVAGAPTLSQVRLSGARPTLTFTVTAGRKAQWLKTISVRLANGASFGDPVRATVRSIGTRRRTFTARLAHGRLRIVLGAAAWKLRVTITTIRTSARVAAEVRQGHTPTGILSVLTTDSSGHSAWAET